MPYIAWEPGTVLIGANELLGVSDVQDQSERREAKAWLEDQLAEGPVAAKNLQKGAKSAGLSWATVRRAKDVLGAVADKNGYHGGWQWRLKYADTEDAHHEDAQPLYQQVSTFEQVTENKGINGHTKAEDAHPRNIGVSTFDDWEKF